jgi:hypothetical protein
MNVPELVDVVNQNALLFRDLIGAKADLERFANLMLIGSSFIV